uniref:Uncharacterized protein n=1 Tax=Oncorhynchus kisutch TaxID=8019 RepID=A0A8C7C9F6_ONCKI
SQPIHQGPPLGLLGQWLWKEEYWLPPGFTWKDIEMQEGDRYPLPQDLLYTLPLALGFIALNDSVDRFMCGLIVGVEDLVHFSICPVCVQSEVLGLGKQCSLSQRQMETWFHHRRNQHRPSNTKKACESTLIQKIILSYCLMTNILFSWFLQLEVCFLHHCICGSTYVSDLM